MARHPPVPFQSQNRTLLEQCWLLRPAVRDDALFHMGQQLAKIFPNCCQCESLIAHLGLWFRLQKKKEKSHLKGQVKGLHTEYSWVNLSMHPLTQVAKFKAGKDVGRRIAVTFILGKWGGSRGSWEQRTGSSSDWLWQIPAWCWLETDYVTYSLYLRKHQIMVPTYQLSVLPLEFSWTHHIWSCISQGSFLEQLLLFLLDFLCWVLLVLVCEMPPNLSPTSAVLFCS